VFHQTLLDVFSWLAIGPLFLFIPFPLSGESIQIKKGANNIGVKIGQV
jgi:hypothetical protein